MISFVTYFRFLNNMCLGAHEWLDDHQQGLEPGSSAPSQEYYSKFKVMPQKPSLLDMMRNDIEDNVAVPPQSPERALTPTIRLSYDYTMDEPPVIQRITETPRHSTPHPDPPTLSARPRPVSQRRAHALHQYHRLQNQRSAWPYVINR